jgi:hypothetical protein
MEKGKLRDAYGDETDQMYDIPNGIIAHLARECGGNVHDRNVVDVTCGLFETEAFGTSPHSGAYENDPNFVPKNVVDLETDSCLASAFRDKANTIPHTRNDWAC